MTNHFQSRPKPSGKRLQGATCLFWQWVLLFALLCPFPAQTFAQPKPNPKADKLYKQSYDAYIYKQYDDAIKTLNKLVGKFPDYVPAYARLGKIYREMQQPGMAMEQYSRILQFDDSPQSQFMVYYTLGEIEMESRNYNAAARHFETALQQQSDGKQHEKQREKADWLLKNCRFAANAIEHPVPFDPVRMDSAINTANDEYLPMLTADEETLVFTRRFNNQVTPEEDFYHSQFENEGWNHALNLGKPINTPNNEGAICISPDGKRLFFAAKDRKDSKGGFDLYYCIKSGSGWKGPYNFGAPVNTEYWESQPSISADGKSLYFASRRKGGKGGIDLWVSHLNKENYWEAPVNLGDNINTTGDEQSPFIHPDNQTLYFSSNGHIGMGDADLYVVRKKPDGNWGEPENLGYPINTPDNENGLIVTAAGERAYYSSFNDSTGLDIFYFDLPKAAKPLYVTYIKGKVSDAVTGKQLSANIELLDLESGDTVLKTVSDPISGEFLVTLPAGKNYMYNVSKPDYLFFSEHFSLKNHSPEKPYRIDVALKPLQIASEETSSSKGDTTSKAPGKWNVGESVVLRNVFFESGSFDLKKESEPELNKLVDLMHQNPSLRIEIGGHTDDVGTDEFNLALSENRARAVYNYLISKKVTPQRLTYKGYGETQPILDNDTDAGRAANRRTEFKILEGDLSAPKSGADAAMPPPHNAIKN